MMRFSLPSIDRRLRANQKGRRGKGKLRLLLGTPVRITLSSAFITGSAAVVSAICFRRRSLKLLLDPIMSAICDMRATAEGGTSASSSLRDARSTGAWDKMTGVKFSFPVIQFAVNE